ncbi:MAG: serine acetyltransferase [Clostridia bacterium]|nr:serine acetyltransferase [Clostridia bacterium]MBR0444803.1 serine acetyltransferase [Clostridia bacterium]
MQNPLVRLGHSLIPEFSADKWWDLRQKALSSKGWKHYYYAYRYEKMTGKYHAFIPLESDIKGQPVFPHGISGIFVSCGARIGSGCVIFHQVTIGSNTFPDSKSAGVPIIGNEVFIGAGAKIVGGCKVGDRVRIGANCVVTENIPEDCTVVPAKNRVIQKNVRQDNRYRTINL